MESTQIGASDSSNYILPTTPDEAFAYTSKLRFEDRRELQATGIHPMLALPLSVELSDQAIKFLNYSGEVAGFAGIVDEGEGVGRVWMLCTDAVDKMPSRLLRGARAWLSEQPYLMLHNHADPRNRVHLKLLHLLGFKRLELVTVGPRRHTFVAFAKLCANR